MTSRVKWKGGDLGEKELSTYLVRSAGRWFGMSWMTSGFGMVCSGERRREVWSRVRACRTGGRVTAACHEGGRPSGTAEAGAGPTARILKGPIQLKDSLVLRTMASMPFLAP